MNQFLLIVGLVVASLSIMKLTRLLSSWRPTWARMADAAVRYELEQERRTGDMRRVYPTEGA